MKIGITRNTVGNIFSNGIRFNTLLWYEFLKKCGYDVYYIINSNPESVKE